jgi:hypothetical protein
MKETPSLLVLALIVGVGIQKASYALIPIDETFKRRQQALYRLAVVLRKEEQDLSNVKVSFKTEGVLFGDFSPLAEGLPEVYGEKFDRFGFHVYADEREIEVILADARAGKYPMADVGSLELVFTEDGCQLSAVEAIGMARLSSHPFGSHHLMFAEVASSR